MRVDYENLIPFQEKCLRMKSFQVAEKVAVKVMENAHSCRKHDLVN